MQICKYAKVSKNSPLFGHIYASHHFSLVPLKGGGGWGGGQSSYKEGTPEFHHNFFVSASKTVEPEYRRLCFISYTNISAHLLSQRIVCFNYKLVMDRRIFHSPPIFLPSMATSF